jgi:hypothetical protein
VRGNYSRPISGPVDSVAVILLDKLLLEPVLENRVAVWQQALALYQGTTSVVPLLAKMVRALAPATVKSA